MTAGGQRTNEAVASVNPGGQNIDERFAMEPNAVNDGVMSGQPAAGDAPRVDDALFAEVYERLRPELERIIAQYEESSSALIPIVHRFQQELGWVPPQVVAATARLLELPPSVVESTISFYTLFFRKPVGRYMLQPCRNLSCLLGGADEIMAHFRERLGIGHLETTADGVFSYEEVECLAACDRAPCMQVNLQFVYDLTKEKIDEMLAQMRAGTFPVPPLPQTAPPGPSWHVAQDTGRKSPGARGVAAPNNAGGIGDPSGARMLRRLLADRPELAQRTRERLLRDPSVREVPLGDEHVAPVVAENGHLVDRAPQITAAETVRGASASSPNAAGADGSASAPQQ